MAPITTTCQKCSKQFLIIDQEQQFLREKGLPDPVQCPQCRQERRLALRGGRQLFRAKCQKCGKDIVTSYDPQTATSIILCREDYEKYNAETDLIVKDPLPDVPGVPAQPTQSTQPQPQMPQEVNYVAQAQPTQQPVAPQQVAPQSVQSYQAPQQQTTQPMSGNIMGGNSNDSNNPQQ